jgi:hypothetical protein
MISCVYVPVLTYTYARPTGGCSNEHSPSRRSCKRGQYNREQDALWCADATGLSGIGDQQRHVGAKKKDPVNTVKKLSSHQEKVAGSNCDLL